MIRAEVRLDAAGMRRIEEIAAYLVRPVALFKDCGRQLANDLREHFRRRNNDDPNKLGGPRTFFWSDVRNAVQNPELDAGGISVTIAHLAFAQKLFGGPIVAKNVAALTIPLVPEAHGRTVKTYEEETGNRLFRIKSTKHPALANLLFALIDDKPVSIYALVQRVIQKPDPDALPPQAVLASRILAKAEQHLARVVAAGAPPQ